MTVIEEVTKILDKENNAGQDDGDKIRNDSCPYINVVEKENELSTWMFVSFDATGKVLVNTVQKGKILTTATKHVLIDPTDDEELEGEFKDET